MVELLIWSKHKMESDYFKTVLNDKDAIERYKDKPLHIALLYALSKFSETKGSISKLPWFNMCRRNKQ